MNRKARRAEEARSRKRNLACQNSFYQRYVQQLPKTPIDAPFEKGRVHHIAVFHDESCRFYDTSDIADCTCSPTIARFVEPRRS